MDRREFFLWASGLCLAVGTAPSLLARPAGRELVIQLLDHTGENFFFLFYDLISGRARTLAMPYLTHAALPIRGGTEFLATSKGAYLFHLDRERIIASRRCPADLAFHGHSSFRERDGRVYTSVISHKGYDFLPFRKTSPKDPADKDFGRGEIHEFTLAGLAPSGSFSSYGFGPHDQRLLSSGDELLVLNASRGNAESGLGEAVVIDLATRSRKAGTVCGEEGACPMSHMYGPDEDLVVVGVTPEASVIFLRGQRAQKTILDPSVQRSYPAGLGEMLNAAYDDQRQTACAMHFDNGFVGLWGRDGKLLRHAYHRGAVSVNWHGGRYVLATQHGFRFLDRQLKVRREVSLDSLGLKGWSVFGPHSVVV